MTKDIEERTEAIWREECQNYLIQKSGNWKEGLKEQMRHLLQGQRQGEQSTQEKRLIEEIGQGAEKLQREVIERIPKHMEARLRESLKEIEVEITHINYKGQPGWKIKSKEGEVIQLLGKIMQQLMFKSEKEPQQGLNEHFALSCAQLMADAIMGKTPPVADMAQALIESNNPEIDTRCAVIAEMIRHPETDIEQVMQIVATELKKSISFQSKAGDKVEKNQVMPQRKKINA